jgi:2-aminoadipate transaminase
MFEIEFSSRMKNVHRSLIRDLCDISDNQDYLSFVSNRTNYDFIDIPKFSFISDSVLKCKTSELFRYNSTEGYKPLKKFISDRYKRRFGINIELDNILITNGSQEALDLTSKIFLNPNDHIIIERPAYPGAIQSFSLYEAMIQTVSIINDGIDIVEFKHHLEENNVKIFYCNPSFQNPTGTFYSESCRKEIARLLKNHNTIIIEDDAYGELGFRDLKYSLISEYLPEKSIIIGSFSKFFAPGMRLGWMIAPKNIMDKLIIAKQATDLHTNILSQLITYEYLSTLNFDAYIQKIRNANEFRFNLTLNYLEEKMPKSVTFNNPNGGNFIWIHLPDSISSIDVFNEALKNKLIIIPGTSFYLDNGGEHFIRLAISNIEIEKLNLGIEKLKNIIVNLLPHSNI